MTNGPHRAGAAGLLAACMLAGVTACTAASRPAAAPTPTEPLATGRLIVEALSGEIGQLTFGADGKAAYQRIVAAPYTPQFSIAPTVAAALSPDGTTLAYGAGHGLVLRNLQTGADQTLTLPDSSAISCVNWAPDGKHLAVGTTDALYVSDRAGHMTSLDTVTSQDYTSGPIGSSTPGALGTVYSSFTCGAWLNPTDLVFQQSGPFPDSISSDESSTLPADTTTVATLRTGAPPRTDNEPTLWSIVATCGTLAVTDSGSGLYLVPGLSGDVTADQAAPPKAEIADDSSSTALFPTGSCQPVLIKSGSGSNDEVVQVNPQTDRAGSSRPFPTDDNIPPLPAQDDFQWGPQPHRDVLAYIDMAQLYIVDLDSGAAMDPDCAPLNNAKLILGWTD